MGDEQQKRARLRQLQRKQEALAYKLGLLEDQDAPPPKTGPSKREAALRQQERVAAMAGGPARRRRPSKPLPAEQSPAGSPRAEPRQTGRGRPNAVIDMRGSRHFHYDREKAVVAAAAAAATAAAGGGGGGGSGGGGGGSRPGSRAASPGGVDAGAGLAAQMQWVNQGSAGGRADWVDNVYDDALVREYFGVAAAGSGAAAAAAAAAAAPAPAAGGIHPLAMRRAEWPEWVRGQSDRTGQPCLAVLQQAVAQLTDMGFEPQAAQQALHDANGDALAAVTALSSVSGQVSHASPVLFLATVDQPAEHQPSCLLNLHAAAQVRYEPLDALDQHAVHHESMLRDHGGGGRGGDWDWHPRRAETEAFQRLTQPKAAAATRMPPPPPPEEPVRPVAPPAAGRENAAGVQQPAAAGPPAARLRQRWKDFWKPFNAALNAPGLRVPPRCVVQDCYSGPLPLRMSSKSFHVCVLDHTGCDCRRPAGRRPRHCRWSRTCCGLVRARHRPFVFFAPT
eukprot:SAG22_NODE_14_length_33165_cov_13.196698_28_plen_507_part_00